MSEEQKDVLLDEPSETEKASIMDRATGICRMTGVGVIRKMKDGGLTNVEVAAQVGVGVGTVQRICHSPDGFNFSLTTMMAFWNWLGWQVEMTVPLKAMEE